METDVRWKQRFDNFQRGCGLLAEALEDGPDALSALEKEGVVQRFEYTFELAWKTLKDYLQAGGIVITPITPRNVIKTAYTAKLIPDGQAWMDMLDQRNLLSHNYDAELFEQAVNDIEAHYLPLLVDLADRLGPEAAS